jgi:Glycosyltransferase family 87
MQSGIPASSARQAERNPQIARQPSYRVRVMIASVALALLAIALYSFAMNYRHYLKQPVGFIDFSTYYSAAYALRMNPQANVYDQALLTRVAAQIPGTQHPLLPYVYPLPFAYLLIPITFLPFSTAAAVFFHLNLALWGLCVLILAWACRVLLGTSLQGPTIQSIRTWNLWARLVSDPAPLVALALSAVIFFTSRSTAHAGNIGQVTFFVLLPLALVPWLTRKRREGWTGTMIAVATVLKIIPGLLMGYLLLRRRWRALAVSACVTVTVLLASLALVGWEGFYGLVPLLLTAGIGQDALAHNQSLLGPILNGIAATDPGLAATLRPLQYVVLAVLALAAGSVLWISWRREDQRENHAEQEVVAYALALSTFVLLIPVAWVHYYAWPLIGAPLLLGIFIREWVLATGRDRRAVLTILIGIVIVGVFLINYSPPNGIDVDPFASTPSSWGVYTRWLLTELRPLGALLLFIVTSYWLLLGRSLRRSA